MKAKDVVLWLPRTYAQGTRHAAKAIRRVKPASAMDAMVTKSITTEQAQAAQRARHDGVKGTVRVIFPQAAVRQWSALYREIGDTETFGMVASYLRVITLNEADGQKWDAVYDEAMASEVLGDGEKDILVELVLEMQERAINGGAFVPVKDQEREFAEMLTWKTENA